MKPEELLPPLTRSYYLLFLLGRFSLLSSGVSGTNCLPSPSVLSGYNGSPYTHFSGTTRLRSRPNGQCYLRPLQSLVVFHLSCPLFSFLDWRCTASSKFFNTQVLSVSTKELVFSCRVCCVLFRLRCNGHRLLLSSYLSRTGNSENFLCNTCGHPSQDTSHFILHCPATDSLRRSLMGNSPSIYNLWSRPWRVVRLRGLHGLPPRPQPS